MKRVPRILHAVPKLPHVQLEIVKAIHTLAAPEQGRQLSTAVDARTSNLDRQLVKHCARQIVREILPLVRSLFDERQLTKAAVDDPKHPGWPAGTRDGKGGQFRPKGGDAGTVSSPADQPGIGHNQGPPLEEPPEIPTKPPAKVSTFIKAAASWLASAIARGDKRVVVFLAALLAVGWLTTRIYKYIVTFQDPPKTLEELRQNSGPGYDRHHIVEQWTAKDGVPLRQIEAPDNIVPIPTLKHWEINRWLGTPNDEYRDSNGNRISPRDYMKGKSWEERYEFGLGVLRRFGVLKS